MRSIQYIAWNIFLLTKCFFFSCFYLGLYRKYAGVFLADLTLVRNLTLQRTPVCHSSSGLYSVQDQISAALSQNGCEAAGGRGCAHCGDKCAFITRYHIIFMVFSVLLVLVCWTFLLQLPVWNVLMIICKLLEVT